MSSDLVLRPARLTDRRYTDPILETPGLPLAARFEELDCFCVSETGAPRLGIGGLERYRDGVLRWSVPIDASARGMAYGTELWAPIDTRQQPCTRNVIMPPWRRVNRQWSQ